MLIWKVKSELMCAGYIAQNRFKYKTVFQNKMNIYEKRLFQQIDALIL